MRAMRRIRATHCWGLHRRAHTASNARALLVKGSDLVEPCESDTRAHRQFGAELAGAPLPIRLPQAHPVVGLQAVFCAGPLAPLQVYRPVNGSKPHENSGRPPMASSPRRSRANSRRSRLQNCFGGATRANSVAPLFAVVAIVVLRFRTGRSRRVQVEAARQILQGRQLSSRAAHVLSHATAARAVQGVMASWTQTAER